MAKILIVDDEPLMREMAAECLRRKGHAIVSAKNAREGLEIAGEQSPDLILSDYKMPGMTGLDFLKELRRSNSETPFVIMTAHGTVSVAVEAMRHSAHDFLEKPFDPAVLEITVERALELGGLRRENRRLRGELEERHRLVGSGSPLSSVQALIGEVAPTRTTVLITGESGTGKELVARAIHAQSTRRDKPFVKVNCAALPEGLIESELFGHEKGAFTGAIRSVRGKFELADGGTLLLDEITEMPLGLQAKLLRVLQEREVPKIGSETEIPVDVRLVCTSNRDIRREVEAGRFREDLYYRLNVIPIRLPPLRDRLDDLPELCAYFIERYNRENGLAVQGLESAAMERLRRHGWPGNVRELENVVQRAVVLTKRGTVSVTILGIDGAPSHRPADSTSPQVPASFQGISLAEAEKRLILSTLDECGQNRTRAADVLGISIRTLRNKLREYRGVVDDAEPEDD